MIATQTNALAETLAVQLRMNQWIATANLEGITHEESLVRAVPGGNHINWILGHVVATRCAVLPALRQESVWSEERTQLYRKNQELRENPNYLPLDEVSRAFHASQERLLEGIAALTDEDLAAPAPFSPGGGSDTLGSLLMKIAVHEAYHLGQTGILRRVVGKPGAIR
ncbi:MAG TPA: DinB family protein [Thermoanaerobaculia bacterium]|nr:DinB family protein [Thermoanaerobaculia bacterium]